MNSTNVNNSCSSNHSQSIWCLLVRYGHHSISNLGILCQNYTKSTAKNMVPCNIRYLYNHLVVFKRCALITTGIIEKRARGAGSWNESSKYTSTGYRTNSNTQYTNKYNLRWKTVYANCTICKLHTWTWPYGWCLSVRWGNREGQ